METAIVAIIVAIAAAWAAWRLLSRRRAGEPGCSSGCGSCSGCGPAKPHPVLVEGRRLARLPRRR